MLFRPVRELNVAKVVFHLGLELVMLIDQTKNFLVIGNRHFIIIFILDIAVRLNDFASFQRQMLLGVLSPSFVHIHCIGDLIVPFGRRLDITPHGLFYKGLLGRFHSVCSVTIGNFFGERVIHVFSKLITQFFSIFAHIFFIGHELNNGRHTRCLHRIFLSKYTDNILVTGDTVLGMCVAEVDFVLIIKGLHFAVCNMRKDDLGIRHGLKGIIESHGGTSLEIFIGQDFRTRFVGWMIKRIAKGNGVPFLGIYFLFHKGLYGRLTTVAVDCVGFCSRRR